MEVKVCNDIELSIGTYTYDSVESLIKIINYLLAEVKEYDDENIRLMLVKVDLNVIYLEINYATCDEYENYEWM